MRFFSKWLVIVNLWKFLLSAQNKSIANEPLINRSKHANDETIAAVPADWRHKQKSRPQKKKILSSSTRIVTTATNEVPELDAEWDSKAVAEMARQERLRYTSPNLWAALYDGGEDDGGFLWAW